MKKRIILTESDIIGLVKKSLLEYCKQSNLDEGKAANILTALGLAAGGVAGLNNTLSHRQQDININPTQTVSANKASQDKNGTVDYDAIRKNCFKQNRQQQDSVKTAKGYYPSDDLIEFIKAYETFHDGWIDDGNGNLTTGWGFKETPELKKRFPTGMHRDENGNTPEADAYLIEYIGNHLDEFKKSTPNIDKLPQEYADALFDVFYNVGGKIYRNSPNLQHALKNFDLPQIANNLKYGKLKGHKLRSADRKNILKGNYKRTK